MSEEAGRYVLTVPVSRLVMTMPRGFVPSRNAKVGATGSRRYFHFEDKALHLIASGWFESDRGYSDFKSLWASEIAAWKRKTLPDPEDVVFETLGSWGAVLYDMRAIVSTQRPGTPSQPRVP